MTGRRSHDDAQSFDEAWSGRPPRDEHIADLVRLAERLCETAAIEPSTQFRESLRTQLMTEAQAVLTPMPAARATDGATPRTGRHPLRRRVAGLTAAVVASVGVVGMVSSSASAVPGEMLYPVKRGVESVQLALHRDDASRGAFQLAQASERLAEARQLSADNRQDDLVAESLDDFAEQAQSGSTSLFSDFSTHGEEKSIRTVNDFAAAATVDLSELSSEMPTGADDSFDAAAKAVSELATRASSLCVSCTSADVRQLVNAVTGLARGNRGNDTDATDKNEADGTKTATDSTPTSSAPTSAVPTKKPTAPTPTTATTRAPSLGDVTSPLIGVLLGDDDQVGLVPGLLNGLLGGK